MAVVGVYGSFDFLLKEKLFETYDWDLGLSFINFEGISCFGMNERLAYIRLENLGASLEVQD